MKVAYFRGWEESEHVTTFARRLDLEQMKLDTNCSSIPDNDKRDHYILEMYQRKDFDRRNMTEYEGKLNAGKDWAGTTKYFEGLIAELKE